VRTWVPEEDFQRPRRQKRRAAGRDSGLLDPLSPGCCRYLLPRSDRGWDNYPAYLFREAGRSGGPPRPCHAVLNFDGISTSCSLLSVRIEGLGQPRSQRPQQQTASAKLDINMSPN